MQDGRGSENRELARLAAIVDGAYDQPSISVRLDRIESSIKERRDILLRLDRDWPQDHPLIDKGVAARVVAHVAAADSTHRIIAGGASVIGRGALGIVLSVAQVVILGWLVIHGVPAAGH